MTDIVHSALADVLRRRTAPQSNYECCLANLFRYSHGMIGAIIRRALVVILGTALGKGVLRFLAAAKIYPDQWVASAIGWTAASPAALNAIEWFLAAIIGFAILVVWERGGFDRLIRPKKKAKSVEPVASGYYSLSTALKYICERTVWAEAQQAQGMTPAFLRLKAIDDIVVRARDGEIFIHGRHKGTGSHVPIPIRYWRDTTIDNDSVMAPDGAAFTRAVGPVPWRFKRYTELWIETSQLQDTWPARPHSWLGH